MNDGAVLEQYAGLVMSQARRQAWNEADVDDLLQEGRIALLEAWSKFDERRGVPFVVLAQVCVRHRMINWMRQHSKTVRARKSRKGWQVSVSVPLDEIRTLAAPMDEVLPGNDAELMARLWEAVEKLPAQERLVIRLRFGEERQTLTAIGEMMGCSMQWVQRLERRALGRLRDMLVAVDGGRDGLNGTWQVPLLEMSNEPRQDDE